MLQRLSFLAALLALVQCTPLEEPSDGNPVDWVGVFALETADVPFRFHYEDSVFHLLNCEEFFPLTRSHHSGDTTFFASPLYDAQIGVVLESDTSISGIWKHAKLPGSRATFSAYPLISGGVLSSDKDFDQFFQVVFRPGSDNSSRAALVVRHDDTRLSGSIMTETGDYRFMEGEIHGPTFWLSTFDGSHLYYARGSYRDNGDITGHFYSRANYPIAFTGFAVHEDSLEIPSKKTNITPSGSAFSFRALDESGDTLVFDETSFVGKVSLVSLVGSWCPNCHDALNMYAELSKEIQDSAFQVLPVAFEYKSPAAAALKHTTRIFQTLQIPFRPYYGGPANKAAAAQAFGAIDTVHAFPTTIVVGKKGRVRKVFTGFTGPGTRQHYTQARNETRALITALLAEK